MSSGETASADADVHVGDKQQPVSRNKTWCDSSNTLNARCSMRLLMFGLASASTILLILPTILTGKSSLFLDQQQEPSLFAATNEQNIQAPRLVEFQKQPGVAIVTKVHNLYTFQHQLPQSLCLLKHAYNHRVQYDIVVFTTQPIMDFAVDRLRQVVAPANLTVVWDNTGLQDMLNSLPQHRQEELLRGCGSVNKKSIEQLLLLYIVDFVVT